MLGEEQSALRDAQLNASLGGARLADRRASASPPPEPSCLRNARMRQITSSASLGRDTEQLEQCVG